MRLVGRIFLQPLSWLYCGAVNLRNFFYDKGLFQVRKLKVPVICIGNLTTGGTGKSPWVISIVKYYQNRGLKAGVISRGYGGDFSGVMQVTVDTLPNQCGDEPLMIFQQTGAPVFVGGNRFEAGEALLDSYAVDVIVMDDGFQHRGLHRDINIILFDALAGKSALELLPLGRLREPLSALKRADLVVFNKWSLATKDQQSLLEAAVPFQPSLRSTYRHEGFQPLAGGKIQESIGTTKVALACGVANPAAVLQSVRGLGLEPQQTFFFKDHMEWNERDVGSLIKSVKSLDGVDLIVTEKDAVKLRIYAGLFSDTNLKVWVLPAEIDLMGADAILNSTLEALSLAPVAP